MEDRYLFKAKDCNSIWRAGLLIALQEGRCAIEEKDGSKWACNSKTICQCTGLKDKNGKLIWENDILNSGNLVVTWREELASYCLAKKGWMYQHFFGEAVDACYCEVIGNIFDNPELINE